AAHRAVVDVDSELGLLKVVELATAQDVGKAINPLAVQGQLEGGAAQGLGLAVMEEIQVKDGVIRNPSFTDYLLPTILDMPPVRTQTASRCPGLSTRTPTCISGRPAATGRTARSSNGCAPSTRSGRASMRTRCRSPRVLPWRVFCSRAARCRPTTTTSSSRAR